MLSGSPGCHHDRLLVADEVHGFRVLDQLERAQGLIPRSWDVPGADRLPAGEPAGLEPVSGRSRAFLTAQQPSAEGLRDAMS
jgi:hypothetical protein